MPKRTNSGTWTLRKQAWQGSRLMTELEPQKIQVAVPIHYEQFVTSTFFVSLYVTFHFALQDAKIPIRALYNYVMLWLAS